MKTYWQTDLLALWMLNRRLNSEAQNMNLPNCAVVFRPRCRVILVALVAIVAVGLGFVLFRNTLGFSFWDKPLEQLLEDCGSKDEATRVSALIALGRHPEYLPASLNPILPALLNENELIRLAAEDSIRALGSDVVPHLKAGLESSVALEFYCSAAAVRILGDAASEYAPIFIERLNSDDFNTKMSCLFVLENFGDRALPALNRLIELLDSSDHEFNLQMGACRVLANLGEKAKPAVPRLIRLVEEGVMSSRSMALVTLGSIGLSDEHDILGILTGKLDSFYALERERSLAGLGRLGSAALAAKPKIVQLMNDPSKSAVAQAAYAYWRITGDDQQALVALNLAINDINSQMPAIEHLGQMGEAAGPAVPALIHLLDDEEDSTREAVVLALGRIGPAASAATSKLSRMSGNDSDELIREKAKLALAAINSKKK